MDKDITSQPVKQVIEHIRQKIADREFMPGDRLPSERKLAESLGVSRSYVREAIKKLELYGILRTMPQSGTFIAEFNVEQLNSLITDAVKIDRYKFADLVYVRVMLEIEVCRLCAMNRTEEDIESIREALKVLENNTFTDKRVASDFAFHRAIARAGHNQVIAALLMIITPELLKYYQKHQLCTSSSDETRQEHRDFLRLIIDRDAAALETLVRKHLAGMIAFAKGLSEEQRFPQFAQVPDVAVSI